MPTLLSGCSRRNLTKTIDKMQEMASEINKMRRSSSTYFAMGIDGAKSSCRRPIAREITKLALTPRPVTKLQHCV